MSGPIENISRVDSSLFQNSSTPQRKKTLTWEEKKATLTWEERCEILDDVSCKPIGFWETPEGESSPKDPQKEEKSFSKEEIRASILGILRAPSKTMSSAELVRRATENIPREDSFDPYFPSYSSEGRKEMPQRKKKPAQ